MGRVRFFNALMVCLLPTFINAQVYGDVIVSWDFNQGIPQDWINQTEDGITEWEYRGPETTPDNTVCARGACGGLTVPPQSESLANGFIIFDSNYWDNTESPCGSGPGIVPGPHQAYLTTSSIDLSNESSITLTFQQQYRHWFGVSSRVQLSVNQGEWIDILSNTTPLTSPNVFWSSVNISEWAANQADVRIRFWFNGSELGSDFHWCLDDVYLYTPSDNDVIIGSTKYTNFDPNTGITGLENMAYHAYPEAFIAPFNFKATALNVGGLTQSGVGLEVNIRNEENTLVHTQSGGTTTVNPGITAQLTGGPSFLPNLEQGSYDLEFKLFQDQEDQDPQSNFAYEDFEITEYVYARDEGVSEGEYTPNQQYFNSAFELGNIFECKVEGFQLNSIAVALSDSTRAGDLVYGIVYDTFRDTILAQTPEFEVNSAYLNSIGDSKWMTIPLDPPLLLQDSSFYNVQVGSTGGENRIRVSMSGSSPNQTSYLIYPDNNFVFFTLKTPMVRMNVFPQGTDSGCTDELASNFDPNAIQDDGSCQFPGCTNELAVNYDPESNFDDGSCTIEGCLDPNADNYNPDATVDNNSCIYLGCTDPEAQNFDPNANEDDGSCIIEGCTDLNATNYDPNATIDDESCQYLGCTDQEANNFNEFAVEDDGSCEYNEATFGISPSTGCVPAEIEISNTTTTASMGTCVFTVNGTEIHTGCEAVFNYLITESGIYNFEYTYTVGSFSSTSFIEGLEFIDVPDAPILEFDEDSSILECSNCSDLDISWFLNGELIEGESTFQLVILENGLYSASVSNLADCSSISEELELIISGLVEAELDLAFQVYPNPSDGIFEIVNTSGLEYGYRLFDNSGRLIHQKGAILDTQFILNLQDYPRGIYTLHFESQGHYNTVRLVKL